MKPPTVRLDLVRRRAFVSGHTYKLTPRPRGYAVRDDDGVFLGTVGRQCFYCAMPLVRRTAPERRRLCAVHDAVCARQALRGPAVKLRRVTRGYTCEDGYTIFRIARGTQWKAVKTRTSALFAVRSTLREIRDAIASIRF